ncbi:MAG: FkbM family methyltransferase [Candidatus Methanomethyliaceae archaeon]
MLAWNDVMGQHFRKCDDFEQGEQSFLLQYLAPGMTVLDIGAHHGLYTLLASKKVGEQGRVIAFEPSPRELRRLKWNLLLNRCCNVHIVPYALGSNEGTAELFVCLGQETGCNSLRPPAVNEPVSKIRVPITTVDHYLERIGVDKVDFMKLDVEGAELEVLRGAVQLLEGTRPLILCELADLRTEPWGYSSIQIYDFLRSRGYKWFSITPGGKLRSCPRKDRFHENLLAVPQDKLRFVKSFVENESECTGSC